MIRLETPEQHSSEAGFTLVEVLASAAILTVALLFLASTTSQTSGFLSAQNDDVLALNLLNSRTDDLLDRPNTDPCLAPGQHYEYYTPFGVQIQDCTIATSILPPATPNAAPFFQTTWSIAPNTPITGVIQINIQISWTEKNGGYHVLSLQTNRSIL
jgi:prepilin-type N-terminal cleavage/methylation domain-containing protein